jgi:hypothetical protein
MLTITFAPSARPRACDRARPCAGGRVGDRRLVALGGAELQVFADGFDLSTEFVGEIELGPGGDEVAAENGPS